MTGNIIDGFNGLATEPGTGIIYAVAQLNGGGQTRNLITIDPVTLVAANVATLSQAGVAGITFLSDGTLIAITGDGAPTAATLWTVDKGTAAMTSIISLGSSGTCCGEAIAAVPAQLSGTTTMTAVGGVATFTNLEINAPATGYTLTASATGLTDGTSATFNVVP